MFISSITSLGTCTRRKTPKTSVDGVDRDIIYMALTAPKAFPHKYSVVTVSYTHLDVYKRQADGVHRVQQSAGMYLAFNLQQISGQKIHK